MILTCPACQTRYQVDSEKFPPQGRNVRCARCSEVWHAYAESEDAESPPGPPQTDIGTEEPQADAYAQAYARDDEPQSGGADAEAGGDAQRRWPRRVLLSAGWGGLGVLVLVIGLVAGFYRRQVVEVWPQSASLYSTLGMKVNASGLDIHSIKYSEAPQDGQRVLTVSGALTNVTDRELPVPQVRVGLVDSDKRELYHWTFAPDVMTLRPGQTTRFVTRLSNPPEKAAYAEVRFAKAGE